MSDKKKSIEKLSKFLEEYEDTTPFALRNINIFLNVFLEITMLALFPTINFYYLNSSVEAHLKNYVAIAILPYILYFTFNNKYVESKVWVMSNSGKEMFSNFIMFWMFLNRFSLLVVMVCNFKEIYQKISNLEIKGSGETPYFAMYNFSFFTLVFLVLLFLYYIIQRKLVIEYADKSDELESPVFVFLVFYCVFLIFYFSYSLFSWCLVVLAYFSIMNIYLCSIMSELKTPGLNQIITTGYTFTSMAYYFFNLMLIVFEFKSIFEKTI